MKLSVLEKIDLYMQLNRQVGHTTAMIKGADEIENVLVVVHSQMFARQIGISPSKFVTVDEIERDNKNQWMKGLKRPLVVDNGAWYLITKEAQTVMKERYARSNI